MKIKKRLIISGLVLSGLLLISGCAKPPEKEIENAKSAIDQAEMMEAEKYAMNEIKGAEDSLNAALTEIAVQKKRVGLFRNYKRAKALIETSIALASSANNTATSAREAIRAEAEILIQSARSGLDAVNAEISKKSKDKKAKTEVKKWQTQAKEVQSAIDNASQLINNNDYIGAKTAAQIALDKADTLKDKLSKGPKKNMAQPKAAKAKGSKKKK